MKMKFAGLLRGLLRQLDDRDVTPVRPVVAAQPAPATNNPIPPAKTKNVFAAASAHGQNEIELPLAPIVAALPMDLRAKIISTPSKSAKIILPVETVTTQLAFGTVKISFGELRRLAPGIFTNAGNEHDHRPINLPLQEIIARLNPDLLARRSTQKFEVAEEISGPFATRGNGVSFTTQPLKQSGSGTEFSPKRNVTPSPNPFAKETLRGTAPANLFNSPPTKSNGNGNGNGNGHDHGSGHAHLSIPAIPFKFSAAPPPATQSSTSRPESVQPTISILLADLAQNWPQELKDEMAQTGIFNLSVALPAALVEPGLKRGRVTMTWKELRSLACPNSAASSNDELHLDLPLKILAPAFLAAQKNSTRHPRVVVPEEIPNLFFGFPQPAEEKIAAPKLPAQKIPDTNYFNPQPNELASGETDFRRVQNPATDFLTRHAQPKEIVAQAIALPGVAGSVIALPDGLRVASETPADLNAETLAAFLPQIFDRVSQSTRELRMGSVNNVSFTVGNIAWKIFRVNAIYFAAFGRAGETLPTAQLANLAAQLDRKQN